MTVTCDVISVSWCGRLVEQRSDDDFVLFNTLKHLVLQHQLISRDLSAFRTCLAEVTAPAPAAPLPEQGSCLLPVTRNGRDSCTPMGSVATIVPCNPEPSKSAALSEESRGLLDAMEAAMERTIGGVVQGLQAVQCAVADLSESRNADRCALEAAVTASTASASAAVAGEVRTLREVIWHYQHMLNKSSELQHLKTALTYSGHEGARGSISQNLPLANAAEADMSGTVKAEAAATGNHGCGDRKSLKTSPTGFSGVPRRGGPARQLAESLAIAATALPVKGRVLSSSTQGTGCAGQRLGEDAAHVHQQLAGMPRNDAFRSSVAPNLVNLKGRNCESGDIGSAVKKVKQNGLEHPTTRDGIRWRERRDRHQMATAISKAPLTHNLLLNDGGTSTPVAAGRTNMLIASEQWPVISGHAQSILANPMIPAAGSEVVWARRAGTAAHFASDPRISPNF